jgi:hypothetical protein
MRNLLPALSFGSKPHKLDSKNHTTYFCVQLKTTLCGPGFSLAMPGVLLASLENSGMQAYLV